MARCAYRAGGDAFWDVHDALFEHQEQMTRENLTPFVRGVLSGVPDVNLNAFESCVANGEAVPDVEGDLAFVRQNQIDATPTLFVNDVRRIGIVSEDELNSLIEIVGNRNIPKAKP